MANSGRMAANEFIRRFLLHALPDRFIASAIMASSPTAADKLALCRQLLAVAGTTPPGWPAWPAKWHDTS